MKKNIYLLIISTLIILYFIFNEIIGIDIPCIFHKLTGLLCPGCGLTRMVKEILHGNLIKAYYYNQLLFISLPIFIILFLNLIYSNFKNIKSWLFKIPNYFYYMYIGLIIVFTIIRNIN